MTRRVSAPETGPVAMPQFQYDTEPLDENEDVLGVFYGGRGSVGQQFVVTNRRLLLGPIDTGIALQVDAYLLDKTAGGGGSLLKSLLSEYAPMNPKTVWLRHVSNVEATNNASLFKAPGVRVTTATGEVLDLGIVKTATTRSGNKDNNGVRDRLVRLLAEAVASAKQAPAQPV